MCNLRVFHPIVLLMILIPGLSGCIPHQQYRDDYSTCTSADPEHDCKRSAMQAYRNPDAPEREYWMGFVELDDQGQLWDRAQLRSILNQLYAFSAEQDLLVMVFVHGWKHSAAAGDSNIATFRQALERLSAMESSTSTRPRKVAGIYLGWRGGSVSIPLIENLTFWDRKNTAHKVGGGGATEVLSQLELLKNVKLTVAAQTGQESATRLIVVGHSFGGAVVYTAVRELLEYGLVQTEPPDNIAGNTVGFADLVVLINPAFEALQYASLRDMANERGTYLEGQLPLLAVLTSEADYATRFAFPTGRWFSTLFEKTRPVARYNPVLKRDETFDQRQANRSALGHYGPYQTHRLEAKREVEDVSSLDFNLSEEVEDFISASASWQEDHPGSVIEFEGSTLYRSEYSAGRNPYLNISVDGELIRDHNDLSDPRIGAFVRQLVLISSQSRDLEKRQRVRARAKTMPGIDGGEVAK
jgi:pimeloyl-ACP methyl ester carboxylesterase